MSAARPLRRRSLPKGHEGAPDGSRGTARSPKGVTVLGPVDDGRRALVRAATWDQLSEALGKPEVDAAHAIGRLRVDVDPRRI